MNNTVYHGIVVEESLDEKIINNLKIIGRKRSGDFLLLKVEVPVGSIEKTINIIQQNLKPKYYSHFYKENELIVVYKNKIFQITPNKTSWVDAVAYGLSLGIPEGQLNFKPVRFEEETY